MNPAAIRLLNQHLAAPRFGDPAAVVAHMGAMQAQEYRMMRWAVAMRTRRPSASAFKAAFDGGRIVRLHLMRGTWQLVAAEDYWTWLALCAPKAIAVTKGWMAGNGISIPAREQARVRDILARTAAAMGSATKDDFVRALAAAGLRPDAHRLSYHIRMAEFEGTLCSGDLLPMKATYALASAKVPRPRSADKMDRDEALALFTRKYFQSRQPATLEDYVWWSGMTVADCRRGIALLGGALRTERFAGRDFLLSDTCRTRGFRRKTILLVPPYDEYLIGYKSRNLVLPPEHRHRAHNNSGIFQPIIVLDGQVCGNWSPYAKATRAEFFAGAPSPEEVQAAWRQYERYKTT